MRINRFELTAFGHFTDKTLTFTAGITDLHVIYGPNEAGKSSALRALKAWLFGFPERTRDDFIHPRPNLLVGGELTESDRTLTFFRRKKRKGDLVDEAGDPLAPELLTPFLGGLDLTMFEALYGIDHDTLVQGGKDILARQGEIGEALFSAGAGLGSLHHVLEEMEAEKNELFRSGRASKPLINKGLSLHKKLSKELRDLVLIPKQWQEHADRLDQINKEIEETKRIRLQRDRRRQHLERLHRALPLFSRRAKILEQQKNLGTYRPLPEDFSRQREKIQQELRTAANQYQLAKTRYAQINGKLQELSPHTLLIKKSLQIEEIFQRLGEYNKAKKDRPRLEGMRSVKRKDAARLLKLIAPSLSLQESEQLLPLIQKKKNITSLSSRSQSLLQSKSDLQTRLTAATNKLELTKQQLARLQTPGDWSQLKTAVSMANKAGDIDKRIVQLSREQSTQTQAFTLRIQQSGHWQGSTAELLELELPLAQTIHLFRDERQELEQQYNQLKTQIFELEDEQRKQQTRQQELIYGGEIPSEEELLQIRKRRDQGWQLICRNWLDQEDITADTNLYSPDVPLNEAVSDLIVQADSISDRLRSEADRVHAFAALRAGEEELSSRLESTREQLLNIEQTLEQHKKSWKSLWTPLDITPFAPKEMADWRAEMEQLQQQALTCIQLADGIKELKTERERLRLQLTDALKAGASPLPETVELAPILLAAENRLEESLEHQEIFQQLSRDRQQEDEQVKQLRTELHQVEQELEQWQQKWREAARIPGSAEPFEPEAAQDVFETVQAIFLNLKETGELESRLKGMDRDDRNFEKELQTLVEETAPEFLGQTINQQVQQLHSNLTTARKEQTLHETFAQELEALDKEILENSLALKNGEAALNKLLTQAHCQKEVELIKVEQDARDHRRLKKQLEEVEQDLQQIAGELPLEELSEQVQAVDADSLPGEIHALDMEISGEIDPSLQTLAERKGEVGKILEQMDGSEQAAEKAEELENNLAEISTNAEYFLRLQIGVDMLRSEIENFRRQNQDPVLTIASDLFARLTLHSFSGLKTDMDDRGEPILVGIRKESRQPLEVATMSTGSRDQLYLALRLASLQHRAENGSTMPFIVDDILINFDNQRSAATLQVLADIGKNNQLILFTHHDQVADQAESLEGVLVHRLV